MKTSLAGLAALLPLALLACEGSTTDQRSSSAGVGSTGGATSTGTSGGGTTVGGTSTGGPDCWGTYPTANNNGYGSASMDTWPETPLSGGNVIDFSRTAHLDPTILSTNDVRFQDFHAQNLNGYRYVLLNLHAGWCTESRREAVDLTPNIQKWLDKGGLVFSVLIEGNNEAQRLPATTSELTDWLQMYAIEYPVSLDRMEALKALLPFDFWPVNIILRLSDMQVMQAGYGYDPDVYARYEAFLDDDNSCQSSHDCLNGTRCSVETCGAPRGVCQ